MYVLYHSPGSSSMAVHIALNEVGAAFEGRRLSLRDREQDPPELRQFNPEGKVPVLVIAGRPLTEVAAILYYLARSYPAAALFPFGNIEAEAQIISWMSFIASSVHPARRQGLEHARTVYHLADERLRDGLWTGGDAYSIADIHLFRLFWRFRGMPGVESRLFPKLCGHYDRMMHRPAVRQTCEAEAAMGYDLPA